MTYTIRDTFQSCSTHSFSHLLLLFLSNMFFSFALPRRIILALLQRSPEFTPAFPFT